MNLSKLTSVFGSADCISHALNTNLPEKDGLYAMRIVWQNRDITDSGWNRIETVQDGFNLGIYMYKFGNDTIDELQKKGLAYLSMSENDKVKFGLSPQDNPNFTTTVFIRIDRWRVFTMIGMGVHTINLLVDRRDNHIQIKPDIIPSKACWKQGNRVKQIIDILGTADLLYQSPDYCVYDYQPIREEKMKVCSTIDRNGNWVIATELSSFYAEKLDTDEVRNAYKSEIIYFAETGYQDFSFSDWARFWDERRASGMRESTIIYE